jgi:hypothetical protein
MAYYVFLKSFRSLEEFMKNPHIKISAKSPCTNFQSPGIFKNPIFIPKQIFLQLSAQSAQQPASPSDLLAPTGLAGRPSPPGRAPFPFLPPSPEPAALPHPPLAPPRHGRHAALLPRHGETPMEGPIHTSVTLLYSVTNPPPLHSV